MLLYTWAGIPLELSEMWVSSLSKVVSFPAELFILRVAIPAPKIPPVLRESPSRSIWVSILTVEGVSATESDN